MPGRDSGSKDVLQPDTVRVRWLALDAACVPHLARWRGMLDAAELARADRFRLAPDRDSFIAAHALARAMLSDATAEETAWRYRAGRFGKPSILGEHAASGLQFSISHTRGCAACAIAFHDVGVDVEAADRGIAPGVPEHFFSPEENALLLAASDCRRAAVFFTIWTLKEAFVKATGEGLQRPLASFSFAFDPLRISFHPQRMPRPFADGPERWQFAQFSAAPHLPVAVAVHRPEQYALRPDARAAVPEEIGSA